jgi:hypothetical protein
MILINVTTRRGDLLQFDFLEWVQLTRGRARRAVQLDRHVRIKLNGRTHRIHTVDIIEIDGVNWRDDQSWRAFAELGLEWTRLIPRACAPLPPELM